MKYKIYKDIKQKLKELIDINLNIVTDKSPLATTSTGGRLGRGWGPLG